MVDVVLQLSPGSSAYSARRRGRSSWHLKATNVTPDFVFPPWVEIKGLWREVAPHTGELMCHGEHQGHLVFSVPVWVMPKVKKAFLAGLMQLILKAKEEAHA